MNESQIAERLKQNIPQASGEPTSGDPAPNEPTQPRETGYVSDIGDATDMYKLYDYFHVENAFRGPDAEQKIQTIYRWASQQVQSTEYLAVAKVLAKLEQGMSGGFDEASRLDKVYGVVKIQLQMDKLRQEKELYYGQ